MRGYRSNRSNEVGISPASPNLNSLASMESEDTNGVADSKMLNLPPSSSPPQTPTNQDTKGGSSFTKRTLSLSSKVDYDTPPHLPQSTNSNTHSNSNNTPINRLVTSNNDTPNNNNQMQAISSIVATAMKRVKLERLVKSVELFNKDVIRNWTNQVTSTKHDDQNKALISVYFQKRQESGLSKGELVELSQALIFESINTVSSASGMYGVRTLCSLVLSAFDLGTDIIVLISFVQRNQLNNALATITILAINNIVQFYCSYFVIGQPLWIALTGLLSVKPIVDCYRHVFDYQPFRTQTVQNSDALLMSKGLEVQFRIVPHAFIQLVILFMSSSEDDISFWQYVSMASSFSSIGLLVALIDRDVDKCKDKRRDEPLMHGYVPTGAIAANAQFVANYLFYTSYALCKIHAFSRLVVKAEDGWVGFYIMLFECAVTFAIRMSVGNWRFYVVNADGVFASTFVHVVWYVGMFTTPFPIIRLPHFWSGTLYSSYIFYSLAINFVFIALGRALSNNNSNNNSHDFSSTGDNEDDGGQIQMEYYQSFFFGSDPYQFQLLLTLLCVASCLISFSLVPDPVKPSFIKFTGLREHVQNYTWDKKQFVLDHHGRDVFDRDGIRALIGTWCSKYYRPSTLLREFYRDNWRGWLENPPSWFDEEFVEKLPRELTREVEERILHAKIRVFGEEEI